MLVDLLDNALKYEHEGMELGVRGGSLRSECRIEVYDRGSGIPAKDLPSIYNRLYRSNSLMKASRTGLGLSFRKLAAAPHGWTISVESQEGWGTTVVKETREENESEAVAAAGSEADI